jgi:hypothetical protein
MWSSAATSVFGGRKIKDDGYEEGKSVEPVQNHFQWQDLVSKFLGRRVILPRFII